MTQTLEKCRLCLSSTNKKVFNINQNESNNAEYIDLINKYLKIEVYIIITVDKYILILCIVSRK